MGFIQATATSTFRGDAGRFIAGRVTPAVRAGVEAFNDLVYDESQILVPVGKTGNLKASGKKIIVEQEKRVIGYVVYDEPYAGYVEFGTGIAGATSAGAGPYSYSTTWPGMAAQPYLRPASDNAREAGRELFKSQIAAEFKY